MTFDFVLIFINYRINLHQNELSIQYSDVINKINLSKISSTLLTIDNDNKIKDIPLFELFIKYSNKNKEDFINSLKSIKNGSYIVYNKQQFSHLQLQPAIDFFKEASKMDKGKIFATHHAKNYDQMMNLKKVLFV
ncbi:MAG: hypothetical protein OMM_11508, partial [Candidatus Magnetoglobus multicellularis str. Araruama]